MYYGSKKKFDKIIPNEYRTLKDLVYESDSEKNTFKIKFENEKEKENSKSKKIYVKNFVIGSNEYAGVNEHVITNFINFLTKFDVDNLFIHNPPFQISEQIRRLYPQMEIKYQKYKKITKNHLLKINDNYTKEIIGQDSVKLELLQALFPLALNYKRKPVVLLFYGKSGVGKTETAKYISKVIGEPLFRKQFSMYQNDQFARYLFGGKHFEKKFFKRFAR